MPLIVDAVKRRTFVSWIFNAHPNTHRLPIRLPGGYRHGLRTASRFQLLLNVVILVVVGIVMLVVQERLWDRVTPLRS